MDEMNLDNNEENELFLDYFLMASQTARLSLKLIEQKKLLRDYQQEIKRLKEESGGAHNLVEDCESLAQFFTGIAELKNARQELTKFTNQQEFEKNKQVLLTKANEAISGLQMRTSNNSSIGGVCIIWADFAKNFNSILNDFRRDLEMLKSDIEKVPYHEAKELQKLLIEEKSLKNEIEENERKARNEPDENKRKQFIFLVDQAKNQLKKCLERRKQLKTGRLGDDFDPDKHINDFLQKLEDKLSGKNKPQRPTRTPNRTPTSPNDPFEPDNVNLPDSDFIPSVNHEPQSFFTKH
ncbi:2416_t:CDS:2 [Ambispora gerdemannii]|uniref:2416_t:CDS:1 n=1 Tax=Ambispora gerdemannii TaxID=144530 RepID=A0A9N9FDV5_9GLOM|nr:2416_t:CDS:2 [Ambispora gerdemannii]